MSSVVLKNLVKSYDNKKNIIDSINLEIKDKEFIVLVGSSGCGKSTILRLISGLEDITSGEILIDNKVVNNEHPKDRDIAFVFQSYALYPHMSVFDNIAFGLKMRKYDKAFIHNKVIEVAKSLNLEDLLERKPKQLSGGQRQRVALGRAIVRNPKVFLMDEPLSNLDANLRVQMRSEIKKLHKNLQTTFIYVTHDQEEALTMSDTVAVMKDGEILQIGTPEDIYNEPKNAFIADFIGESNIIDGIMHDDYIVEFAGYVFDCVDKGFEKLEKVDVVIRPEDIIVVPPESANISGLVESAIFKGVHFEMILDAHGYKWIIHSTEKWEAGTEIGIDVAKENIHIMKKTVEEVII